MTASSFPDFITARRRELELTLGDVAARLGVSPITVSNWSNGDSTPNPQNLVALAELLEVPPNELADMAGVTLDSPADGVNLLPADCRGCRRRAPLAEEADVAEPVAELRLTERDPVEDSPEVEAVTEPDEEVQIPSGTTRPFREPWSPSPGRAPSRARIPTPSRAPKTLPTGPAESAR